MSSRATGTSSLMQMYCCLRREPQALCSRLNDSWRLASVAEYSFTGIATSPKDTVRVPIDLAAMATLRQRPPRFCCHATSHLNVGLFPIVSTKLFVLHAARQQFPR